MFLFEVYIFFFSSLLAVLAVFDHQSRSLLVVVWRFRPNSMVVLLLLLLLCSYNLPLWILGSLGIHFESDRLLCIYSSFLYLFVFCIIVCRLVRILIFACWHFIVIVSIDYLSPLD